MQLKKLRAQQDILEWPTDSNELPVVSWESFQEQAQSRPLVLISGYIHDVSRFMDEHPGGRHLLAKNIGRDATTAFFGGVYDHSNAAHNVRLSSSSPSILHSPVRYQRTNEIVVTCDDACRRLTRRLPTSRRSREIRTFHPPLAKTSSISSDGDD